MNIYVVKLRYAQRENHGDFHPFVGSPKLTVKMGGRIEMWRKDLAVRL